MWFVALGKGQASKLDEFSEKCQRGESFSIQKFMLQILGTLNRVFEHEIDKKKRVISGYAFLTIVFC